MNKSKIIIPVLGIFLLTILSCKSRVAKTANVSPKAELETSAAPSISTPEKPKTADAVTGYKVGDKAEDFALKNTNGKMVSLAGIKNAKGYIVVFTCNACPYAVMYEDRLIALHNTYAAKGYSVVAINPNSSVSDNEAKAAMLERSNDKGFPFAYLADDNNEIWKKYGASRTPHVYLLDKQRKVQYIGAIDDNAKTAADVKVKYLENAIAALENGKSPDPSFTKAIGCTIKAK
jgi:peroxiredoxin